MRPSFKKALNLFCAKQKVTLFLLLIPFVVEAAPLRKPYGPHVIETAGQWLIEYLEVAEIHKFYYQQKDREAALVSAFKDVYFQMNDGLEQRIPKLTEYRRGGDPIFNLKVGEAPRMAVTGEEIESPVIFNLGLISDPTRFTYGDAIALWTHEIGHKVRARFPELKVTQVEVDELGAKFKRWFGDLARIQEFEGLRIFTLFPVPPTTEGASSYAADLYYPAKIRTTFAVIDGEELIDFSEGLEQVLDRLIHPSANYIESTRMIEDIQMLKSNDQEWTLRLELRTAHLPKTTSFYVLGQDLGQNLYRSIEIGLRKDFGGFYYGEYRREKRPRPLIMDAEAELSGLQYDREHRTVKGQLRMHMKNQKYFHAASYPVFSPDFLVLIDGRPERLSARVDQRAKWHPMPHEAYQKEQDLSGTFEMELGDLRGQEIEFLGMVSRFFEYGGRARFGEEELYRVRFKEVHSLSVDDCENRLR